MKYIGMKDLQLQLQLQLLFQLASYLRVEQPTFQIELLIAQTHI